MADSARLLFPARFHEGDGGGAAEGNATVLKSRFERCAEIAGRKSLSTNAVFIAKSRVLKRLRTEIEGLINGSVR